jgi:transposase-like protein
MNPPTPTTHYKNHRFPVEIISHAVWLYFRFCLSFRDVEELLFERGVVVTYEAIRKVPQVRAAVCQSAPSPPPPAWRQVAPR